jgi:YVTN family beta-propeller protein
MRTRGNRTRIGAIASCIISKNVMKKLYRAFFLLAGFVMLLTRVSWADVVLNLENPTTDQQVSGISVISGWAFSTIPGAQVSVSVSLDGQASVSIPCCVGRADVANEHGPQALNSGFGQVFNFNLLTGESHTITVTASDDHGGSASVSNVPFTTVKPGGFEFLSSLDLLLADASIDGKEIVLEGVTANEKGTNNQQEVTLHLAWQQSTQALGIVQSDDTGSSASTIQTAQTEPAQSILQSGKDESVQSEAAGDPAIVVTLENPPNQKSASGIGVVSGWAVSSTTDATINSVQLKLDNQPAGNVPCCSERADVANDFPNQPQALHSGFGAPFNFNLLPSGPHIIGVDVQDSTSASVSTANAVTTVKLGNSEFLDEFSLSGAEISLQGQILVLDNVTIRDKATQAEQQISVHYAWQESCQCFVAQSTCGNSSVEPTEECDGTNLAGESCTSLGFSGGTLACGSTCEFETKDCTGGPRLYVTNLGDNTVSVINTATNAVEGQPIQVGKEPRGIAIAPNGASAYVTNFRDDTVSVINTATNAVTTTIALRTAQEKKGPRGVAVSPDGTKVYVVNGFDNSVSVIDTNTNSVVTNITVGLEPQEIALTPDGQRAYVTSFATNSVTVLDLTSNTTVTTVKVGATPEGVAVSPDGQRVYVANYNANQVADGDSVSIIDTGTNTTVGSPLDVGPKPFKIAFSPDGTRAYVTSYAGFTVAEIDTATTTVVNEILTQDGPTGVVVGTKGKRVYVALLGSNNDAQEIEVLSPISSGTITLIQVGKGPFAVALTPTVP